MYFTFVASFELPTHLPAGVNVHVVVSRTIGVSLLLTVVFLFLWDKVERAYHGLSWPVGTTPGGDWDNSEYEDTGDEACPLGFGRALAGWVSIYLRQVGQQLAVWGTRTFDAVGLLWCTPLFPSCGSRS